MKKETHTFQPPIPGRCSSAGGIIRAGRCRDCAAWKIQLDIFKHAHAASWLVGVSKALKRGVSIAPDVSGRPAGSWRLSWEPCRTAAMSLCKSRVGQLLLTLSLLGATQGEVQQAFGRQHWSAVFFKGI